MSAKVCGNFECSSGCRASVMTNHDMVTQHYTITQPALSPTVGLEGGSEANPNRHSARQQAMWLASGPCINGERNGTPDLITSKRKNACIDIQILSYTTIHSYIHIYKCIYMGNAPLLPNPPSA